MEYPGSRLTKRMRTAIFFGCVLLFLVITPIIILTATGYRYDWSEGFLRENGAISIDIKPSSATAFLDGIKIKDKMPVRLSSITARKYNILITDSGHYDWTKEVEVKNKETVYIKEISLLKKAAPRQINKKNIVDLKISADGKYLAYSSPYKGGGFEIWILQINKKVESLATVWQENLPPLLSWSLKDDFLAISSPIAPYKNILTINANNKQRWTITPPDKSPIKKYQWQNTIEPEIFFSTKDDIYSARSVSQNITLVTKNTYLDWLADEGKFWTMNFNSSTGMMIISRDSLGFTENFASVIDNQYKNNNQPEWQIYLSKNDTVILKNITQPIMMIIRKDTQKIVNGLNAYLSPFNNWWLFWTPWELNTYSAGEEPKLLMRSENQLQNVLPIDQYNTLALIWNNKTSAIFPYYDITQQLLEEKIKTLVVDNQSKKIYYSTAEKSQPGIWSLDY